MPARCSAAPGGVAEVGLCSDSETQGCPPAPYHPCSLEGFDTSPEASPSSGSCALESRVCLYAVCTGFRPSEQETVLGRV